ncbi:MAG: FAD/NAD(P)-binding protein [Thermoproteota archaeon]
MNEIIMKPEKATIVKIKTLTDKEKLFKIELDNGESLNHQPGQFVMLYLPGYGEAPFSISSSPTDEGYFELCVRAIGRVTNGLHKAEEGDEVGIRGPFGNGFDVDFLRGKDLLFISGGLGIAPLRSLVRYVRDNCSDYGEVHVLYGCKEPNERLFVEELEKWGQDDFCSLKETVDKCPEGIDWDKNIGVITTLIPKVDFNPETTYAVVCGPPIMYKFVVQELDKKGLPADHIFLSLERRMKCGVGECGHCQIGEYYTCRDGPVFNYAEIKDLEEAI